MVGLIKAKEVLANLGWLSRQPESFREEVLRRAGLMRFAPGDLVYDLGDPPGGVYGLVEGAVSVTAGPLTAVPRLGHVGLPGSWIGIGAFISRGHRRIGMRAAIETWMMYLPLEAMDQMERQDSTAVRRFTEILMSDFDTVLQAFLSLQNMDADRRVASTLTRIAVEGVSVPVSQAELGTLANTSRKHVNVALHRFEAAGWLTTSYRSIFVKNIAALRIFAESDDDD
ncbi:Crp/Fnr family transcriptional regulator [Shinella sp.]|uniref:Crp/Fnr family transcriptional regulator n=1 Tax=Shinella sp. TaxID=1870904 RepID=UPI003F6EF361